WWRERVIELPRDDRWGTSARSALRDELYAAHADLTEQILRSGDGDSGTELFDQWVERNGEAVKRSGITLSEIQEGERFDLATLSVALRSFRGLIHLPLPNNGAHGSGRAPRVVGTAPGGPYTGCVTDMDPAEKIKELAATLASVTAVLDLEATQTQIAELREQSADPELWSDQDNAQKVTRELAGLESMVNKVDSIEQRLDDL